MRYYSIEGSEYNVVKLCPDINWLNDTLAMLLQYYSECQPEQKPKIAKLIIKWRDKTWQAQVM